MSMPLGFITGKSLPRRTFLRGMGATVALPFLDAMVPAGRKWKKSVADSVDQTRLLCIEEVHGLPGSNAWGASQYLFAPEKIGKDFEMVPANALKGLEAYQDYLTIISNTDVRMAEPFVTPEIGGDHFRSAAVFLTQSHPKQTQGSDLFVGTSMDQLYAQRFGQDTPLPSMQLTIESVDQAGGCTYNYACAYMDALSWSAPDKPLPMIRDPRVAFELMFGAGGTPEERLARMESRRSILDWITGDIASLQRQIGQSDRTRMDMYLTNVREIERRIQLIVERNTSGEEREIPEAPVGVPDRFTDHMEIMFDLQVLAFETDLTRVISFKTGRDASTRRFPESGFDGTFHPSSHYGSSGERVLSYNTLKQWRISHLTYLLDKLQNSTVGDSNLLEKSVVMWGSPMGDSNLHNHRRCPLFMLGKGNGILEGNLHVKAPDGTPMANAMLALLHGLGLDDLESFGDSTGVLPLRSPSLPSLVDSSTR